MLIILEGCDGTGKTTIAKELEGHGFAVVHQGPPQRHPVVEYTEPLDKYQPGGPGRDLALDRWLYGELVYPTSRRDGQTQLTTLGFSAVDEFLRVKGAVLIHCTSSLDLSAALVQARGEPFDRGQWLWERDLFDRAICRSDVPTIRVDLNDTLRFGLDVQGIIDWAARTEAEWSSR